MRVVHGTFTIQTNDRAEFHDITKQVSDAIQGAGVSEGVALVNSLHTTCALFLNEFESALMDDVTGMLDLLVAERGGYRHDDPRYSDCERGNGHAHLRAALLGHSVLVEVSGGQPRLGPLQSIILGELDGPRPRTLDVQIVGQ